MTKDPSENKQPGTSENTQPGTSKNTQPSTPRSEQTNGSGYEKTIEYSRIKDIVVPLFKYKRFHKTTHDREKLRDRRLIERGRLINVLVDLLHTEKFSGTYLVAGFRGVGKTTLLRQAIRKFIPNMYNQAGWLTRIGEVLPLGKILPLVKIIIGLLTATVKNLYLKYTIIDINLSHKDLMLSDILKTMSWSLYDQYSKTKVPRVLLWAKFTLILSVTLCYLYLLLQKLIGLGFFHDWQCIFDLTQPPLLYEYIILPVAVLLLAGLYKTFRIDITHRQNIERLKLLIDRLNSSLKSVRDLQAGNAQYLSIWKRTSEKIYRDLNDKEIAYELSEVINAAGAGPWYRTRSRFIFVVDELDKIEAVTPNGSDAHFPNDHLRRKREKIFEIVGEMKHLFTTTKAKFFFVTGSEMYDAALADVTERDSYLGSIFDQIIYIPSVYTDFDNQSSDITEQTENLLCKFLIDPKLVDAENTLRKKRRQNLQKQLRQVNPGIGDLKENIGKEPTEELNPDRLLLSDYFYIYFHHTRKPTKFNHETIKLHYILSSYVQFLTLRSKGSPKKIITLIEENLVKSNQIEQGQKLGEYYLGNTSWKRQHKTRDYLIFDEIDQYKIGLTSYLYSPFLYSYSPFIANYSDKLILSSAFIWDHIYKYHNAAFSVHHLEYIYELTASSKEPGTKHQLTFLLALMKSRHLREIRSGIFEIKFFSKVSNEIKFLSNVVQSESAVFNFTLDESLSLKRYYTSQLENAKKDFPNDSRNPFLRGFLSRIIGDLHFFDKEYDRAIVYYEDALKYFFRIDDYENFSNGELANMVRWLLLLSLANEKSGHYTKSFAICKDIQREFMKLKIQLRNEFKEILLYSKIPYAHIIQKLSIIEKTGLNGLNATDLETAYTEIKDIYDGKYSSTDGLDVAAPANPLIQSEINFKINNILYYRNTRIDHDVPVCRAEFEDHKIPYLAQLYLQCIVDVLKQNYTTSQPVKDIRLLTDVLDLTYLKDFCSTFGPNYTAALSDYFSKAGNAFIAHCQAKLPQDNAIEEYENNVSEEPGADPSDKNEITDFLNHLHIVRQNRAIGIPKELFRNKYFLAARMIQTSAILSKSINDSANESAQYLKLLYIIRNIVQEGLSLGTKPRAFDEIRKILTTILKRTHGKNDNFKRLYIQKYRARLYPEHERTDVPGKFTENRTAFMKSFPDAPDCTEAIILYYEILTKYNSLYFGSKKIQNFINTIDGHDVVQSQYIRVMELSFKTRSYYNLIDGNNDREHPYRWIDALSEKLDMALKKAKSGQVAFDQTTFDEKILKNIAYYSEITMDAIYCLAEILRLLNIQGNSFIIGYSRTGNYHRRLGWWILFKRKLDKVILNAKPYYTTLRIHEAYLASQFKRLIHDPTVPRLGKYNLEMAKSHFAKAKETHKRGQPYREAINNMYTLDDDFNDDFAHFQVALERMNISSGSIDREINKCNMLLGIIGKTENPYLDQPGGWEQKEDWIFDVRNF